MNPEQKPLASSAQPGQPGQPGQPTPPTGPIQHESIRFYSHSQLFYFWPVWVVSYVFALMTALKGEVVKTQIVSQVTGDTVSFKVYPGPGLGLAYLIILVCVVIFTSVNIRGIWAALVAATSIIVGLIFSLFNWWGPVLKYLGGLSFYLNLHFYLAMGIVMSIVWALVVFVYDRRRYIEFKPTQLTIVEEVGDGEKNYDTVGLVFDKKRDNFFQHWLLGFGSGDLEITTSGGQRQQIYFHNVLGVSSRIDEIQKIREQRGR